VGGVGTNHHIYLYEKNQNSKTKNRKVKNLTGVWKIRKFWENYKFHRNPKVLGKLQIFWEFQSHGKIANLPKTLKVPGNFSYPEFPDNSILSTIEKRKFQHGTGASDVLRTPTNPDEL
jgi:hypothetical protein